MERDDEKRVLANRLTEQAIFLFYRNGGWVQADDELEVDVDSGQILHLKLRADDAKSLQARCIVGESRF